MASRSIKQYQIQTDFLTLCVLNYGAIITSLELTDKNGKPVNVVIDFEKPKDYLVNPMSLGACIGPYAGRIAGGTFKLHNKKIQLDSKNGVHLHGGENGWSMKYWDVEEVNDSSAEPYIKLRYQSPHSENGYPGNIAASVTYKIINNHSLMIRHEAISDADTVINLTNHTYFNLSGKGKSINQQLLKIKATTYLETDAKLLPTGKILPLAKTDKDFSEMRTIGETRVDDTYIFDHCLEDQITIEAPYTGITMRVKTNQPAVVVFTPQSFPAICFETQNYPDAPNHPHFPSALLKAGEKYLNESVFDFSISNSLS